MKCYIYISLFYPWNDSVTVLRQYTISSKLSLTQTVAHKMQQNKTVMRSYSTLSVIYCHSYVVVLKIVYS